MLGIQICTFLNNSWRGEISKWFFFFLVHWFFFLNCLLIFEGCIGSLMKVVSVFRCTTFRNSDYMNLGQLSLITCKFAWEYICQFLHLKERKLKVVEMSFQICMLPSAWKFVDNVLLQTPPNLYFSVAVDQHLAHLSYCSFSYSVFLLSVHLCNCVYLTCLFSV